MVQPPKKEAFLGKLARFVSNPTTDWSALDSAPPSKFLDAPEMPEGAEFSQTEIMAMRHKRRKENRRIRVKEFGMLRNVRAGKIVPGVVPDFTTAVSDIHSTQPAGEDEIRPHNAEASANKNAFDINKIDNIEQQMIEQWWDSEGGVSSASKSAEPPTAEAVPKTQMLIVDDIDVRTVEQKSDTIDMDPEFFSTPLGSVVPLDGQSNAPQSNTEDFKSKEEIAIQGAGVDVDTSQVDASENFLHTLPIEKSCNVDEGVDEKIYTNKENYLPSSPHLGLDELSESFNEAAILFAQDQDEEVEAQLIEQSEALKEAVEKNPELSKQEPHVLLALLDYYRATQQEERFENACLYMVQLLGRSAPQYLAADLAQATRILSTVGSEFVADGSQSNWSCSAELDLSDVMLLRSQLIENPAQVLLDWRKLKVVLDEAVEPLVDQLKDLSQRKIELLMWGGRHLLDCCKQQMDASPQPEKNIYALLWRLRLQLVGLMCGQEAFENESLDYCIALEESPPPWIALKCFYINADEAGDILDDAQVDEDGSDSAQMMLESNTKYPLQWKGSIRGSIKKLLIALDAACDGQECVIDCLQLERIDSIATTELLAWLMARSAVAKRIQFINVNRLVAVFWRIMGIHAQADIELRCD